MLNTSSISPRSPGALRLNANTHLVCLSIGAMSYASILVIRDANLLIVPFIVLPQLLVTSIMGGIIRTVFSTDPIWTMAIAAIVMGIAALLMLRVQRD